MKLGEDNIRINFEQLYFESVIPQLNNTLIRFGIQDIKYILRPNDGSLILDVTEAESFFKLVNEQYPFFIRDTIEPAGLLLGYPISDKERLDFFMLTNIERGKFAHDESLFGLTYKYLPKKGKKFSGLILLTTGGSPNPDGTQGRDQAVFTFGVGTCIDNLLFANSQFYFEGYVQVNEAGRNNFGESLRARGSATRTGYQQNFPEFYGTPYFDLQFIYISGDNDYADTKEGRFLSYENNDRLLILENNEYGLDWDSNYFGFVLEIGITIKWTPFYTRPIEPEEVPFKREITEAKIPVIIKIAYLKLARNLIVLGQKTDDLGVEIDLVAGYQIAEKVYLQLCFAELFNSRICYYLSNEMDNKMRMFTVGITSAH
jgi:hypothetical protein